MRVFFDVRMIAHPGIGRYIRNITLRLREKKGLELVFLGNKELIDRALGGKGEVVDFNYPIYSITEQIGFQRIKKIIGNDIVHVPHYNIPFWGDFKLVVTIHDLIHIMYPAGASNPLASSYMKFAIRRALARARKVICVSDATKTDIEEIFKPAADACTVVGEGIDDRFAVLRDQAVLEATERKFNLPRSFILYVGSIRKHKNIEVLIEAHQSLRKRLPHIHLVLAGKRSQDINLEHEGVIYAGEVEEPELVALYNRASVFCQLSLYEGFSLTVLEAQKCGLPVVCSDIPPHREVTAQSAFLVPPDNVDRVAGALYNILTDEGFANSLITKGIDNSKRFDWNRAASQTIEIYKSIGRS